MSLIKCEFVAFEAEFKKYKELLDKGLKQLVRSYAQEMVQAIAKQNPVGNVEDQMGLYRLRQTYDSRLDTKAGLSANNWRVAYSPNVSAITQSYSVPPSGVGIKAFNQLENYTLGKTIYIVNTAPHINQVITGEFHHPSGKTIYKDPFEPVILNVIQRSYDALNREVATLVANLNKK